MSFPPESVKIEGSDAARKPRVVTTVIGVPPELLQDAAKSGGADSLVSGARSGSTKPNEREERHAAKVREALLGLCEWVEFDPFRPGGFECSHGFPIFECPGEYDDEEVLREPCKDRRVAVLVKEALS